MAAIESPVRTPSDADLRRYEQLVVGVVARRFPALDRSDVEDCCQQAFVETWSKRGEYGDAYPNVLVTTALRRASDHWRRYHARNALVDHQDHAAFAIPGDEPDPAAEREFELRRGAELLSMLPPHHQRIWRAYCDTGARHNVAAINAIADAEGLKPRQVTKVIDKVKEKARRIAATSLTADLEVDDAYCRRLEPRIERHLGGRASDPIAKQHLDDCARCRALFDRTRGIERAAAALLPPLPILHELEAFAATTTVASTSTTASVVTSAKAWIAAGAIAVGGGGTAAVVTSSDPEPVPRTTTVEHAAPAAIAPAGSAGRVVRATPTVTQKKRETPDHQKPVEAPAHEPASTPTQPPAEPEHPPTAQQPETREQPAPKAPKQKAPAGDAGEFGIE
jgi:hypothetical protein